MRRRFFSLATVALSLLLMAAGCQKREPFALVLQRDATMQKTAFVAHVVGVDSAAYDRWFDYSMTKYWKSDDALHSSVPFKEFSFAAGDSNPQVLTANDPVWKQWLGRQDVVLFVLVSNPYSTDADDAPGAKDPRRIILPIDNRAYVSGLPEHEVKLTITKPIINLDTPLKSK
jgi:hypothetical protein